MTKVAEPVWYQRRPEHRDSDKNSSSSTTPSSSSSAWWPAIRFPNVWTAYAVCHEMHLQAHCESNHEQEDPVTRQLFDEWTTFALEQTVAGRQDQPVLARLEAGPCLQLVLVSNNDSNNNISSPSHMPGSEIKSFFHVSPTPTPVNAAWKRALQHMQQILSSSAAKRPLIVSEVDEKETVTATSSASPTAASTAALTTQTTTHTSAASAVTPHPQPPPGIPHSNTALSRTHTLARSHTLRPTHSSHHHNNPTQRRVSLSTTTTTTTIPRPNDDDAPPPIEGEPIGPTEPWDVVFGKLQFSGYTQQPSARGPIYVKPGGRRDDPSDVLRNLAALQDYCRQSYGWVGPPPPTEEEESSDDEEEEEVATAMYGTEDDMSTIRTESTGHRRRAASPAVSALTNMTTPADQRTRPQDPAKPLLASGGTVSSSTSSAGKSLGDSVASDSSKAANRYWDDVLAPQGWWWKRGFAGRDWHFIRPGKKDTKGYELGKDYFATVMDAYNYATNRKPRVLGRGARRKAAAKDHRPKKTPKNRKVPKKKAVTKKTPPTKTSRLTKRFEKVRNPTPTTASRPPKNAPNSSGVSSSSTTSMQKSRKKTTKSVAPPDWSRIRTLLETYCGFDLYGKGKVKYDDRVLNELQTAFCLLAYGIPKAHRLRDSQMDLLHAWLRHLTLPSIVIPDSTTRNRLKTALHTLHFACSEGRVYLPGAPRTSRRQLVHGTHYFDESELESAFVHYLRENFVRYVPGDDRVEVSSKEREALGQVWAWLQSTKYFLKLPEFDGFPDEEDDGDDFWDRLDYAVTILSKKAPTRRRANKPREDDSTASSHNDEEELPVLDDETIESILFKLGYRKDRHGVFSFPGDGESWDSLAALRDFSGRHGIQNYTALKHKLTHDECKSLFFWAFGRLVTPEEYVNRKSVSELSEAQVQVLLNKGGWHQVDGKWYHPESSIANRTPGIHIFSELSEVARQVSLYPQALLETVTDQEALQLRLWALHADRLDLKYQPPIKRRRGNINLDDVMLPYWDIKKKTKALHEKYQSPVAHEPASADQEEKDVAMHDGDLTPFRQTVAKPLGVHDVEVRESPSTSAQNYSCNDDTTPVRGDTAPETGDHMTEKESSTGSSETPASERRPRDAHSVRFSYSLDENESEDEMGTGQTEQFDVDREAGNNELLLTQAEDDEDDASDDEERSRSGQDATAEAASPSERHVDDNAESTARGTPPTGTSCSLVAMFSETEEDQNEDKADASFEMYPLLTQQEPEESREEDVRDSHAGMFSVDQDILNESLQKDAPMGSTDDMSLNNDDDHSMMHLPLLTQPGEDEGGDESDTDDLFGPHTV